METSFLCFSAAYGALEHTGSIGVTFWSFFSFSVPNPPFWVGFACKIADGGIGGSLHVGFSLAHTCIDEYP